MVGAASGCQDELPGALMVTRNPSRSKRLLQNLTVVYASNHRMNFAFRRRATVLAVVEVGAEIRIMRLTRLLLTATTPSVVDFGGFVASSQRFAPRKGAHTDWSESRAARVNRVSDAHHFLRRAWRWTIKLSKALRMLRHRIDSLRDGERTMLRTIAIASSLALACSAGRAAITLGSAHAIVVDAETGEVLLQKDALTLAPMASLTKLMTAMVVLDAEQDTTEEIRIADADLPRHRHRLNGVPVAAVISRGDLLALALIASDNRAASALARSFPGGMDAFRTSLNWKVSALGLGDTVIEEPTGLSANNLSSAQDMIKILRAAAAYPVIAQITSKHSLLVLVSGRQRVTRNTNRMVGAPGWNIMLSKTGFTDEAGSCLSMRITVGRRSAMVVLMGAASASVRARDAMEIRRWLAAEGSSGPTVEALRTDAQPTSSAAVSTRSGRGTRLQSR